MEHHIWIAWCIMSLRHSGSMETSIMGSTTFVNATDIAEVNTLKRHGCKQRFDKFAAGVNLERMGTLGSCVCSSRNHGDEVATNPYCNYWQ